MAPIKVTPLDQAAKDRKARLRVRNGPAGRTPALPAAANNRTMSASSSSSNDTKEPTKETPDHMFTVVIDEKHVFNVLGSVLKKAPVFAAMCNDDKFIEGQTKMIELHDDDITAFKSLLEYLGSSRQGVPRSMRSSGHYPEKLVQLYILANKYRVAELEEYIITALELYYLNHDTITTRTGKRLFDLGETVYGSVAGTNDPFKMWFRPMITVALKDADDELMDHVLEIVHDGDDIAVDICRAQADAWKESRSVLQGVRRLVHGSMIY